MVHRYPPVDSRNSTACQVHLSPLRWSSRRISITLTPCRQISCYGDHVLGLKSFLAPARPPGPPVWDAMRLHHEALGDSGCC